MSEVRIWGVPPRAERRIGGMILAKFWQGETRIVVCTAPRVSPAFRDITVPAPVAIEAKEIHFAIRHYREPRFTMIGPKGAEDHRLLWELEDALVKEEMEYGQKVEKEISQRCPQCGCTIPK